MRTTIAITALLSLAAAAAAGAQTIPPITSNRPGIGESEELVPRRSLQFEMGASLGQVVAAGDRVSTISTPELTVRFGLARRVELFAGGEGLILTRDPADGPSTTRAGSDLSLDTKVALVDPDHPRVAVALAAGASFPTGTEIATSGSVDPTARFLWSTELPWDFAVSGNVGMASRTLEGVRRRVATLSTTLSRPWGSRTTWFVEMFGDLAYATDVWTLDGGVGIVTAPDVQIDISAGRRVHGAGNSWFVSGGVSLRYRRQR